MMSAQPALRICTVRLRILGLLSGMCVHLSTSTQTDAARSVLGFPNEETTGVGLLPGFMGSPELGESPCLAHPGVLDALGFGNASEGDAGVLETVTDGVPRDTKFGSYLPVSLAGEVFANDGLRIERKLVGRGAPRGFSTRPVEPRAILHAPELDAPLAETPTDEAGADAEFPSDFPR